MTQHRSHEGTPWRFRWILALSGFLLAAAFLLWTEHRAHILGALPYLILLLCPVLHLLMHGGHRHGGHGEQGEPGNGTHRHGDGGPR